MAEFYLGSVEGWILCGGCVAGPHHVMDTRLLSQATSVNIFLHGLTYTYCLLPTNLPHRFLQLHQCLTPGFSGRLFMELLPALGSLTCSCSSRTFTLLTAMSLGGGFLMIKSRALAEQQRERAAGDYSVAVDRSGMYTHGSVPLPTDPCAYSQPRRRYLKIDHSPGPRIQHGITLTKFGHVQGFLDFGTRDFLRHGMTM